MFLSDIEYMQIALEEANKAELLGEVPVGAIAVNTNGEVVAKCHNLMETKKTALAHAEILLIKKCSELIQDWRLDEFTFYVTKEPCVMCTGAMVNSHLKRLVFGIFDHKSGGVSSQLNIANNSNLLWQIDTTGGVLEDECLQNFKNFFVKIRKKKIEKN